VLARAGQPGNGTAPQVSVNLSGQAATRTPSASRPAAGLLVPGLLSFGTAPRGQFEGQHTAGASRVLMHANHR
jgi:hypothetical protein